MKDPNWIKDEVVLTIHEQQLAEHGGSLRVLILTTLINSLSVPASPAAIAAAGDQNGAARAS